MTTNSSRSSRIKVWFLFLFQIVVAIRVNNDADDFYKTYYLNKYNRNYRDDQKESKENARKLAKHIAIAITESNNYEEQSHSEGDRNNWKPIFQKQKQANSISDVQFVLHWPSHYLNFSIDVSKIFEVSLQYVKSTNNLYNFRRWKSKAA